MPELVKLREPYKPLLPPCANKFLSEIVGSGIRVLEFGSGASTLWFAQQGCEVVSVEHDRQWAAYLKKLMRGKGFNVDLVVTKKEKFPGVVSQWDDDSFDLVFVDCWSRIRNRCVEAARSKVRMDGWLLLDDTQWSLLRPSVKLLSTWDRWDFCGIVFREGRQIIKRNVEHLNPQAKVEVTRCTFWQR